MGLSVFFGDDRVGHRMTDHFWPRKPKNHFCGGVHFDDDALDVHDDDGIKRRIQDGGHTFVYDASLSIALLANLIKPKQKDA